MFSPKKSSTLKLMGELHSENTIYLTLRSISSLNNPQNREMKYHENMKFHMLKIIKLS
jgi:hypothetical protein